MRAIRSARGSSPNMASLSSKEPEAEPSIDVMSNFMASLSLYRFGRWGAGFGVNAELAGQRRILPRRLLHPIAPRDPASRVPRHRALDQNEAAIRVGAHDAKVLRRQPIRSHMPVGLL